jgi:DNA polymerase-1
MIITIANEDFDVAYTESGSEIDKVLLADKPKFFTYDTETDSNLSVGIHLKRDKPVLGAICYNNKVWVFPTVPNVLKWMPIWRNKVPGRIYGHNMGFDLHMTANVMGDDFPLKLGKVGDTMGLMRLTFESESVDKGGDSIALKNASKKYIGKDVDKYEKGVKSWLESKRASNRKILVALLAGFKSENGRRWGITRFEEALNKGTEKIPQEVIDTFQLWQQEYPNPTYADVPKDILLPYLAVDVILTKMWVMKSLPIIVHRKEQHIIETEFDLIPVVYKMERRGIKVDREYLANCEVRLDAYIEELYTELHELAGMKFKVGQHKVVNDLINEKVASDKKIKTDKSGLKKLSKFTDDEVVLKIAEITSRLRRLEKWRSTYVQKILRNSEFDGRFYTQMSQFQPVTGRFSGDAQQFPKDPIYTAEGYNFEKTHPDSTVPDEYVLYHPRKAFLGYLYYLDYSQVELRAQGHYTLYFGGDDNLLRAYMPYKCKHYKTGETYDFKTMEGRNRWSELREGSPDNLHWEKALKKGYSVWVIEETRETWIPTDVHMATTLKALITMGHNPDEMDASLVKWWRKKGKTFNFMRNYGGGDAKAAETLDISLDQARAMNQGYTDAFPVVVTYQDGVIKKAREFGYVENLSGRRYYLSDWNKHYKLANYLIQGSCADELKKKMIEVDSYMEKHGLWKTLPMVLCVHDELQFENVNRDPAMDKHIKVIKGIMEDIPNLFVPIVAECEVTTTNWAEKKDFQIA